MKAGLAHPLASTGNLPGLQRSEGCEPFIVVVQPVSAQRDRYAYQDIGTYLPFGDLLLGSQGDCLAL